MSEKKDLVKWDINFLEYPNWLLDNKKQVKTFTIEKEFGTYTLSATEAIDRLPDRVDKAILYCLLLQKRKNISTTRYQIAKTVFKAQSKYLYDRVMKALKRWASITIEFNGVFYEGDEHTERVFHIIDGLKLGSKKNGKEELSIHINKQFYEQLEKTKYFKHVDFQDFLKLKRPVSAMLYEVLIKDFFHRDERSINIFKLAEKLTLRLKYPSDILKKLWPAIKEINKNTRLKFEMEYDKEKRKCIFTLLKEIIKPPTEEEEQLQKLLALLPAKLKRQKSVKKQLDKYLKQKGFSYVQSNIIYTLQKATKNKAGYLSKSLKNDYGEEVRIETKIEQEQIEKRKKREKEEKIKEEKAHREWKRVMDLIKKYGGKGKALYKGYPVLICNLDFLAIDTREGRQRFRLEDVKEKDFAKPKKKKRKKGK